MNMFTGWLSSNGLMPQGFCYQWRPALIWLHAISDSLIALAFFLTPAALLYVVRRRKDIPFGWMFICFAVFIAACGASHAMAVWTLWVPSYWLSGGVKLITALASVPTAVFLVRLMPAALSLPNTVEMNAVNDELKPRASAFEKSEERFREMAQNIQEITARKKMDVVLRESEDRYRDLVEHSTDLICTYSLEGRLLSVNELPAKLLGYSQEELLKMPMRDFLLPEARAQFDESLKTIQRDGFVKGLMVVLSKTGERRMWEYHNTLRTEGVASPIVRGIAHDVTDQRRIEKALRLSEEKFSKAFHSSPIEIAITTLEEGRFLDANESFERNYGFLRDEIIGHTSLELGLWVEPHDRAAVVAQIKRQGRVQNRETLLRSKSGETRVKLYSAESIEIAGKQCLLVTCEDITERKRAEERFHEYEKAVEGVEEMIVVVDREYRYLLANRAFLNFRKMKREQVVGRLVSEVIEKEVFDRVVKEKLDECFRGNVVKYELKFTYPDWGERDLLITYFPVEGPAGVERAACVIRDITDRKRADAELRRLSGQILRSQDEERRRIARELHDSTGQDLVALATTLSQLHASIPSSSKRLRKCASQCQALADRSIREVRTLSYLLHPPMLDEAGLGDAIRHYLDGFTRRTGINVALEISPRLGRMTPNLEVALFRVVQEGLTNTQRHSGSLRAGIRIDRDPKEITLEISDSGSGIVGSLRKQDGTLSFELGVGIPSMQERVRLMGGRLEIESRSSGTTVRVMIPIDG
jgi:PAS domain S-box-containing protein